VASILDPLKKYAVFQGRARRSEYWPFTLVVSIVLGVLEFMGGDDMNGASLLFFLLFAVVFLPLLAVQVRRLHDINRTGWWVLIGLVPVVGGLVLLVFTLLDGTPGDNRFGPDPKGWTAEEIEPEPMVS
jgi:uncharacterized membrane protein YhaH (DUF805 family)